MPTVFTHTIVAVAGSRLCHSRPLPARFWLLAVACSTCPDLDVGLHAYGVKYHELWGHRGFTHSLTFAIILALVLVTCLFRNQAKIFTRRWYALVAFFFALTASHGFLDAFTDDGLGIAFFSPFNQTRYFMPVRPLPTSYFGVGYLFTAHTAKVLAAEFLLIWVPLLTVTGAVMLARRQGRSTSSD